MLPTDSKANLKKKAIKSGAVTMSAQVITILIQLVSIVTLSRLLPPADFGIIAMITAITAVMGLFRDMGLSTASVQKGQLTYEQTNLLFWLNVATGTALMIIVMALSPVIAWFYKRPELQSVTLLLSITFLLSSLGAQHAALMQRELRFKPKAIADISGALLTLLTSVTLALHGLGFWALAWGAVAGTFTTSFLYFSSSKFKPGLPKRTNGVRQMLGFGANVTAFELVNYFSRNLDNVLIGRIWGAEALGFYSRAYQMLMIPISSLRTPINAVAFPVLSKLKNEPDEFRRYYCQITALLAFLSMPLMGFLSVNAADIITLALGNQWIEVVPVFVLLGLTGFIQPVASLRGLVLLSLGKSSRYLKWGIINAAFVCSGFFIGVTWGAFGVACAYAIVNYAILYPSLLYIFKDTPIKPIDFLTSIAVPSIASIVASIGNIAVTNYYSTKESASNLILAGCIYSTLFGLCIYILPTGREKFNFYIQLIKKIQK